MTVSDVLVMADKNYNDGYEEDRIVVIGRYLDGLEQSFFLQNVVCQRNSNKRELRVDRRKGSDHRKALLRRIIVRTSSGPKVC